MLEVGWSELLVIAIVMIVVVGPKDLPKMLRTFATFAKKARGMASDFQAQFTDAMQDAELDEVRKTLADVRSLNPKNALKDAFDPIRKAGEDVKRELNTIKSTPDQSIAKPASPNGQTSTVEPMQAPLQTVVLPDAIPLELVETKGVVAGAAPVEAVKTVKKPRAKKSEAKA